MNSEEQGTGKNSVKPANRLMLFLLAALSIGNVLLIAQNLQLRARLEPQPDRTTLAGPEVGDDLSILATTAVETPGSRRFPHVAKTLLIFLSPSCVFSREMSPDLADTLSRLNEDLVGAFGIAREDEDPERVVEYLGEYGMEKLTILYASDEVLAELGLFSTPTTLILDGGGIVTDVWTGLWSADDKSAVNGALAIDR